jgi:hypothetical protein
MKGTKNDRKDGKLMWELLPFHQIEKLVKVLTLGALKYSPDNWKKVPNAKERYFAALMRHIIEYRKGNKIDKESGEEHLSHALCNIIFLMEFDNKNNTKEERK